MNNVSIAQLQNDVAAKLQAEAYFVNINIVLLREKLFESEIQLATVWQTSTNGISGLGIVVMMPSAFVEDSEAPGPQLIFKQRLIVLEEPNINQRVGGTGLFAEDVGAAVIQTLHEFALAQDIVLFARGQVMTPNREYEDVRGVNIDLEFRLTPNYNQQVSAPTAAIAAGHATLTCITAGAAIYYTLDGSFPAPSNAASVRYAAPFAVQSGQQIRTSAWLAGWLGSNVWQTNVP